VCWCVLVSNWCVGVCLCVGNWCFAACGLVTCVGVCELVTGVFVRVG